MPPQEVLVGQWRPDLPSMPVSVARQWTNTICRQPVIRLQGWQLLQGRLACLGWPKLSTRQCEATTHHADVGTLADVGDYPLHSFPKHLASLLFQLLILWAASFQACLHTLVWALSWCQAGVELLDTRHAGTSSPGSQNSVWQQQTAVHTQRHSLETGSRCGGKLTFPQVEGLGGREVGVQSVLATRRKGWILHRCYGYEHHILQACNLACE